jgi:hypothetical protein
MPLMHILEDMQVNLSGDGRQQGAMWISPLRDYHDIQARQWVSSDHVYLCSLCHEKLISGVQLVVVQERAPS